MISKILLGLTVVTLILIIFIASRSADFRIERSALVSAQPAAIFPHINDLRKMNDWSPWAKMDPNATNAYAGPATGKDATMTWSGNKDIGQGAMTITDTRTNELVVCRLEFIKPFQATNRAEFALKQETGGTMVTWTMTGKNNFIAKAVNLLIDCDKMVGGQFEKGLEDLKKVAEATPSSASTNFNGQP